MNSFVIFVYWRGGSALFPTDVFEHRIQTATDNCEATMPDLCECVLHLCALRDSPCLIGFTLIWNFCRLLENAVSYDLSGLLAEDVLKPQYINGETNYSMERFCFQR